MQWRICCSYAVLRYTNLVMKIDSPILIIVKREKRKCPRTSHIRTKIKVISGQFSLQGNSKPLYLDECRVRCLYSMGVHCNKGARGMQ